MAIARAVKNAPPSRASSRASLAVPAAPPRLGKLGNRIGFAIRLAQLAVFEDFNARLAPYGVNTARFSVLSLVRDNPGINQTALAEALRAETSRMVLLIDELERRGWVTRLASTVDRRARALYLTAEGRKKLKILEKKVDQHERHILRRLRGADKAALLQTLRNLAKAW